MACLYPIPILSFLLLALVALQGTHALHFFKIEPEAVSKINSIHYEVTNNATGTPGGTRFTDKIGIKYSKSILQLASEFNWRVFRQSKNSERKNVESIKMYLETMDGVAYASNDEIHVSASYIAGYSGDVKREITGVLYHEVTHIWQWNGNGNAPGGLIEGIADYVRLKAKYAPSHWVKPGGGDRWDQGYDVTARFLDYCSSLRNGFVADVNRKMKTGYSDEFFVELLGKNVNELWRDYKKKYSISN
ncbi:hypothetical protein MKX01_035296 [Papaver californicum]|nr:hypothetical protein MKX01_035296 [Papaver californicum]